MSRLMKHTLFCSLLACHCLTVGCSRMSYGDKILADSEKIKPGMERKEVIAIPGAPLNTVYDKHNLYRESMFYYIHPRRIHTDEPDRRPVFVVVYLESNQVFRVSNGR